MNINFSRAWPDFGRFVFTTGPARDFKHWPGSLSGVEGPEESVLGVFSRVEIGEGHFALSAQPTRHVKRAEYEKGKVGRFPVILVQILRMHSWHEGSKLLFLLMNPSAPDCQI